MKKYAFIAVAVLAAGGLASCDEFTMPDPPAQSNEEEALFSTSDLTATDLLNGTLDLATYNNNGTNPDVLKYSVNNLPSERSVKFVMQISKSSDFATVAEVATTNAEDGTVSVSTYDLQQAYNSTLSRDPAQTTLYVRYPAYITNEDGTENIRVGGPDVYYCSGEINFTPVLLGHEVETTYYLIGSFNNFEVSTAQALIKSQEGNPYDEPDFYLPLQVSIDEAAAGYTWAIIPGSAYNAGTVTGAYGATPTSVDDPLSGSLVETDDVRSAAGSIPAAGSYMLKVNMYDLTYSISLAYESLYVNAQGYYTQYSKMLRLFTDDYVSYEGVVRTSKNFRLCCQASNTGLFYGEADGRTAETVDNITTGTLQSYSDLSTTPALTVPVNGFYYVWANIKDYTWKAALIENISIVGSFNGWNQADANTTMTADRYKTKYTYSGIVLDEGGEFKFNCNKAWDLSFGGEMDNIVENGGNLKVPAAGTYDVTLDFTTIPYSVTLVQK